MQNSKSVAPFGKFRNIRLRRKRTAIYWDPMKPRGLNRPENTHTPSRQNQQPTQQKVFPCAPGIWYSAGMHTIRILLSELWRSVRKMIPRLTVLVTVFVLLRGVTGTADAVRLQFETLATSLLGTGDGLTGVLVQTLPLAIAAAVATFAVRAELLTFESPWSFVGLAGIILAGATVGGFLRDAFAATPGVDHSADLIVVTSPDNAAMTNRTDQPGSNSGLLHSHSVAETPKDEGFFDAQKAAKYTLIGLPDANARNVTLPASTNSPLDQLASIEWLATPKLEHTPAGRVPPLKVFPELGGILGVLGKAINQVLGFLVAYQPRLFLAAVVAGGWVGWSIHHRIGLIEQHLEKTDEGLPDDFPTARAA